MIVGYCYVCRGVEYDVPFEAAISSWAQLCDEVVVLTDPRFQDGTLGRLNELGSKIGNLHVETFEWRLDHPAADGMAKALAREIAERAAPDILVSFDADEVLYEDDVPKMRRVAADMLRTNLRVVGTGVLNWFNGPHVKWCEPITKERLSTRAAGITHGVPGSQRIYPNLTDREFYYAANNTDGAGYIEQKTLASVGIQRLLCEPSRVRDDPRLQVLDLARMTASLQNPNHVWIRHYSWFDIPRKWEMKPTWHYLWKHLWGEYPNGIEDYQVNPDTGDWIDFWAQRSVPYYHMDVYEQGIRDEMEHPAVLRAEWVRHPENEYLTRWLSDPNRRTMGLKRACLPAPPSKWHKAKEMLRQRLSGKHYEFD